MLSPLYGQLSPLRVPTTDIMLAANAYIAAVEAADGQSLESGVKSAFTDFIVGCHNDGIWTALKSSCILAGARTLSGALVPLVGSAPTNFNFVSGDYDRKIGLKGNATTKRLNSNRRNNADPQNNQHLSVYQTEINTVGLSRLLSGRASSTSTGSSQIACDFTNNRNELYSRYNGTLRFIIPRTSAPKFLGLSRSVQSSYTRRYSSTSDSLSDASATPNNDFITVFCNPALNSYTNARLSYYSIGESLDLAALDTRVSTLMTDLAAAIP